MWNPFRYEYTPIKNPALRAVTAVVLLPFVFLWWVVVVVIVGGIQSALGKWFG